MVHNPRLPKSFRISDTSPSGLVGVSISLANSSPTSFLSWSGVRLGMMGPELMIIY